MSLAVRTVAVVGAGTMGRGIAYVAALGGFETRLFDPDPGVLDSAHHAILTLLDKGEARGKVKREDAASTRKRLVTVDSLEMAVQDADLVIEAVPESIEIKHRVFSGAEKVASDTAIFASNTSALSITEIAAATSRPDRFAGMHFFNPVHVMRLIELVAGRETSDETLATLSAVGRRMGKEIVTVNESPGFVTTRINVLIGNEAFRMLEEGVASARDIDTALKLGLNHPMGPFEMADLVGLDVRLSILEHLHETLGELYRPSRLLVQLVADGRLGRKAGRGVYEYDEDGNRVD